MIALSCYLIDKKIISDSIGVPQKIEQKKEVLILKHEDVYSKEFYEANQQGNKPSLRIVISSLSYNDENELEYMNKRYSIIRTQNKNLDEIILVCERKINNV